MRPLAGLGWSVDQVLRRALELLEDTHVEPEPVGHVFTRKEIVAALSIHDGYLVPSAPFLARSVSLVEESVTQLADHVSGPVFVPADGERRED